MSFLDRGPESRHVDFTKRPLANDLVDRPSLCLLIVGEVVLDIGDSARALSTLDTRNCQTARQPRIFSQALKRAATPGDANNVDVRRLQQVGTEGKRLLTGKPAIFSRQFRVPGSSKRDGGRQSGRLQLWP